MLKEHFIECRDYIFNFLEKPMIPSDNNASERGIRTRRNGHLVG